MQRRLEDEQRALDEATFSGFRFAFDILDSLLLKYDRQAMIRRLAEVARAETTLYGSVEEEVGGLESLYGRPLTEAERAAVRHDLSDRTAIDLRHRMLAVRVLRELSRGPSPG